MKSIYKYPVSVPYALPDKATIKVHEGARLLSVKTQHNQLVIYAVVDTDHKLEDMHLLFIGTGNKTAGDDFDHTQYLGTELFMDGSWVVHVFAYQ